MADGSDGGAGGGDGDSGVFDVRQVASGSDGGGQRSSNGGHAAGNGNGSVGGGVDGYSYLDEEEEEEEELEVTQPDDGGFDSSWGVGAWVGRGAAGDSGGFGAAAEEEAVGAAASPARGGELDSAGLKRDRNGRRTTPRPDGVHSASKRSHGRTMMVEAVQSMSRGGAPNLT